MGVLVLAEDNPTLRYSAEERGWEEISMVFLSTYHLLNSMKRFPMKTKGLLKQDFIFHSPLIWEGGKVGQISQ